MGSLRSSCRWGFVDASKVAQRVEYHIMADKQPDNIHDVLQALHLVGACQLARLWLCGWLMWLCEFVDLWLCGYCVPAVIVAAVVVWLWS